MSETDRSNKIQNTWFQYQNFSFCVKLFKTQQICDQPFLHLNDNFFKKVPISMMAQIQIEYIPTQKSLKTVCTNAGVTLDSMTSI